MKTKSSDNFFKNLREELGFKSEEVNNKIGISPKYFYRFEKKIFRSYVFKYLTYLRKNYDLDINKIIDEQNEK